MVNLQEQRAAALSDGKTSGSIGVFYEVSADVLSFFGAVNAGGESVGYAAIDIATGETRNFIYLGGAVSLSQPGFDFDTTKGIYYSTAGIDDFSGFGIAGSVDLFNTNLGGAYSPGSGAKTVFTGTTSSSATVKFSFGYTFTAASNVQISELYFDERPSITEIGDALLTVGTENGLPVGGVFDGVTIRWSETIDENTVNNFELQIRPGYEFIGLGPWNGGVVQFGELKVTTVSSVIGPNGPEPSTSVKTEQVIILKDDDDKEIEFISFNNFRIDPDTGTYVPECFPAGTQISLSDGSSKPIEKIALGDLVLTYDASGSAVPGVVDKLFTNTTSEFVVLRFADGREDMNVTPGHRFLTETGDYIEIGHMLRLGGGTVRVVDVSGEIVEAAGEVITYSVETAHQFAEAQSKTIAFSGNTVLKEQVEAGWQTYNFEVRTHHNYVAGGIRVHNDSILSQLQEGDQLIALNDSLTDAAVFRDVNGDGHADFVTLDGFRDPSEGVFSTRVLKERIRYWEEGNDDWETKLADVLANSPEAASNVFDPQSLDANGDLIGNHGVLTTGNTWGDGAWGDDIEEAFFNDVMKRAPATSGTTPSRAALDNLAVEKPVYSAIRVYLDGNLVTVPSLDDPLTAAASVSTLVGVINGMGPGSVAYLLGGGDQTVSPPAGLNGAAVAAFLLGIPLTTEIVPAVTVDGPLGPIEVTPAITLATLLDQAGVQNQTTFTIDLPEGISPDAVTQAQDGDNLVLTIDNGDGTTNTMTIADVYADGTADEVAAVKFADGQELALSEVGDTPNIITPPDGITGTDSADTLIGTDADDTIVGLAGDDTLTGGAGNDVFWLAVGDGNDVITDFDKTRDKIDFGNLTALDISISNVNEDAVIYYGNGDSVTLKGVRGRDVGYNDFLLQALVGPDTLAFNGNPVLVGTETNDTLDSSSNDTYDLLFGYDGDDTITGTDRSNDLYGGNGDDYLNSRHGRDYVSGGAGNDTLVNWAGWGTLDGGSGNDVIYAGNGKDRLIGGLGDDRMSGGSMADSFVFRVGDGHDIVTDFDVLEDTVLIHDVAFSSLSFSEANGNAVVSYGNGDSITFIGVSAADLGRGSFTDREVSTASPADLTADQFTILHRDQGTGGNDLMIGDNTYNAINAGAGNDYIVPGGGGDWHVRSGGGSDILFFAPGSDDIRILDFEDGQDKIELGGGLTWDDLKIWITPDNTEAHITVPDLPGNRLVIDNLTDATGSITAADFLFPTQTKISGKTGTEGDDLIVGTDLYDAIDGKGGDDYIVARGGGDWHVRGGAGADTFVFDQHSDDLRILDFEIGVDKVRLEGGITWDDFKIWITPDNTEVHITLPDHPGNRLILDNLTDATLISAEDFII